MNPQLESISYAVNNSRHVTIDYSKLEEVCSNIKAEDLIPRIGLSLFDVANRDLASRIDFAIIFNSVNFCYWGTPKWTIKTKDGEFDGAFGMVNALRQAIDNGYPLLDSSYLKNICAKDLESILHGNVPIPLFSERLGMLQETGRVLGDRYNGHFVGWFGRVANDAVRLVDVLTKDIKHYHDGAIYKGKEIFFHKRAQLAITQINTVLTASGQPTLANMDELTDFADYKVPQILRKKGLLVYDYVLSSKVDSGIPLENGSVEEIEIRANDIWAIESMVSLLKPRLPQVNAVKLHSYFWQMGQIKSPDDKPYHRTITTNY